MDYAAMYESLGFTPSTDAIKTANNNASEATSFEIFTLLKHVPEKLVSHTSPPEQQTAAV
jgi:hypothetical protein